MARPNWQRPVAYHVRRLTDAGTPFSQSLRFDEEPASATVVVTPLFGGPAVLATLEAAAHLLERITFDSDGIMVGMQRQGGNGGIISNETLRAADALRRAFDDLGTAEPIAQPQTKSPPGVQVGHAAHERLAVAQDLEDFALIDEAEGGNPLVIATERRAAKLLRQAAEMTDTKNTVSDERLDRFIRRASLKGFAFAKEALEIATALQSLRASIPGGVGVPDEDSETYYVKGKDGAYWEALSDEVFARELSYACQDLNDTGLGDSLDKWMPFQVMMGDAAKRIERLSSLDLSPAEGGPLDVSDQQVLSIAHRIQSILADKLQIEDGEIIMTGPASYKIARLFKPAAPSNPVISDEMVERACDSLFADWRDRASWTQERMKKEALDALTAALSVKPQSDGGQS